MKNVSCINQQGEDTARVYIRGKAYTRIALKPSTLHLLLFVFLFAFAFTFNLCASPIFHSSINMI